MIAMSHYFAEIINIYITLFFEVTQSAVITVNVNLKINKYTQHIHIK